MSDTQETIADIIAEMRGARTEFPFVYLMGEPDTPEVIDSKTKEIVKPRKINIRRVTVTELADRFEAAHKRELAVYVLAIAKLRGALVKCRDIALLWQVDEAAGVAGTTDKPHARSAAEAVIDIEFEINAALFATATAEKLSAVGDAAKLREALVQAELFVGNIVRHGHQTLVPGDKCTACDGAEELRDMICAALAEPVRNCDRPECATTKAAQDVWRKEDGGETAYYEWLLATATEKEGGDK